MMSVQKTEGPEVKHSDGSTKGFQLKVVALTTVVSSSVMAQFTVVLNASGLAERLWIVALSMGLGNTFVWFFFVSGPRLLVSSLVVLFVGGSEGFLSSLPPIRLGEGFLLLEFPACFSIGSTSVRPLSAEASASQIHAFVSINWARQAATIMNRKVWKQFYPH